MATHSCRIICFVDAASGVGADDGPVRRRRVSCCLASALTAVVLQAAPAGAADVAGPLVPGASQVVTIRLPAGWAAQADTVAVSVTRLSQEENECLPPEVRAGDSTCSAGGGDLAEQLSVDVGPGGLAGDVCQPSTTVQPLDLRAGGETVRLPATRPECLAVRLSFPHGADDNLAQSDTLSFDLAVVAAGPRGVSPGSGTGTDPGAEPAVGADAVVQPARGPAGGGTPTAGSTGSTSVSGVVGSWNSSVEVAAGGPSALTEASSSSPARVALLWAGALMGNVMVGGLLFMAWRRRRERIGC